MTIPKRVVFVSLLLRCACPMRGVTILLVTTLGVCPLSGQELRVYFIDVDQGDATLIIAPGGESLLIDSGNDGHGARIRSVLQQAEAAHLDAYLTTHYHSDHYGGVDELSRAPAIQIRDVFDRGDKEYLPAAKLQSPRYLEYDTIIGYRARHLQRGETIPLGAVTVTCISSGGVVLGEQNPQHGHDENDMSISLLIEWEGFRLFVGGDIESFTEQKIAALDAVLDVDVYQVNHHGSHSSSSSPFLRDLAPTVVVISNGDDAGYKHPRQVTLDSLAQLATPPAVFQINRYTKGGLGGNVANDFISDWDPRGPEGTITLTASAARGEYDVAFANTRMTFAIKPRSNLPARVVIQSLLPDPIGSDVLLEEVTVRNDGPSAVDLTGWYLHDEAGRRWPLKDLGTLAAGGAGTSTRNGLPLNLNNTGDTVMLHDPLGVVRDSFTYSWVAEGVRIETGH